MNKVVVIGLLLIALFWFRWPIVSMLKVLNEFRKRKSDGFLTLGASNEPIAASPPTASHTFGESGISYLTE